MKSEIESASRKASDLLVSCLEAEGVEWVFGVPGEETLDLNESLSRSSIRFVPVRHEQAAAYMADAYGRLTGRAGVCLATLGPGATNLVTGVADAFLDRAPMVVLTGQGDLERMHKESHQNIDVLALMRPITKWNARVSDPAIIPEVVRKAFKVAEAEKPGSTHIELPEDVMALEAKGAPLPRTAGAQTEASSSDIARAVELLTKAANPIALAGYGAVREEAAQSVRQFSSVTGIPVASTFMAKGLLDPEDPNALGSVGLQAGDYRMAGFDDADLVITIGFDLVEHAPRHWNPQKDKKIVCIDSLPAEIDEHFTPDVELVGDIAGNLGRLADRCAPAPRAGGSGRLREAVRERFLRAKDDPESPLQPPRVLYELRQALGREDILVSDVGLHKLWIGRMFPAYEPNTVLISNGLAGMGFALPAAIAAKMVFPERKVVSVSGDGGFLMNAQELETAVRLKAAVVSVVWEDGTFGSIAWKQQRRFGRTFGVEFGNPDFVAFAESFGIPGWRCETATEFAKCLEEALATDGPSLIVIPIDYSPDVAIVGELGKETVAT
ncbi:MAG: acetolactate synthase large subunit [Actinomycetota bacterium]